MKGSLQLVLVNSLYNYNRVGGGDGWGVGGGKRVFLCYKMLRIILLTEKFAKNDQAHNIFIPYSHKILMCNQKLALDRQDSSSISNFYPFIP